MNIQIHIILIEIAHRYIYHRRDPSTCTYKKYRVDEIHFLLVCQTYKKVCKIFCILEFGNFNKNKNSPLKISVT
jgi:hypothetical protein